VARRKVRTTVALAVVGLVGVVAAEDWPRWRGPKIDALCQEKGLLKTWPAGGPRLLWAMNGLGVGYSTVAVVGNRAYTMGDVPTDGGQKRQFVIAIDLTSRKVLWRAEVGPPHSDGSRCTPTYDEGRLYAIGTDGDLVCVDAASGRVLWRKNFGRDFGGRMMTGWKYSESPLVDGEKLLCTPGAQDAMIVALNKKTGETIWKCAVPALGRRGKPGAGYSSIVISNACGVKQYVQLIGRGVIGVRAEDGKFLWGYNKIANGVANVPTPVVWKDYVFCSTAYGTGAALLKLQKQGDGIRAREVYFLDSKTFQNHHGGFVLVDGHIYGGSGHNAGAPTCIELLTGKIVWKEKQPGGGSGAVLYADGNLIIRYQRGEVVLIAATPEGYQLRGQFKPPRKDGVGGPAWAHPVVSGGRLYLRHRDVLYCYDLRSG